MAENLDSKYCEEVPEEHNAEEMDEGYPEGHLTSFKFSVCPYPIIKASEYQYIYHTRCKSLPTSWKFDVKFEEGSSNSCLVSISRSDSIDKPVDAYVWLQGFDIFEQPLYGRIAFFKGGILPSVTDEKCIQELAPVDKLKNLPQKFLFVKVSALIVSCHQKIVPSKESEEPNVEKMAENLNSKSPEQVTEGHYTSFKFSVCPYPFIKESGYQHIYHTHCKSSPTSWWFNVNFEEGYPNSCVVHLIRNGSRFKPVCDVHAWVSCFDIHNRLLCYPRIFFSGRILPFVSEGHYIPELIPFQELRILAQQTLVVKVFALITSCHQKIAPSKESERSPSEEPNVEKRAENLNSKRPEQVTEGHYISFTFSVCPYPIIKASKYQHIYHTRCKSLPTSWKFDVEFVEGLPNACFLYVSRSDSIFKPVCDAYVWVSCFDIHNRRLCSPRIFFEGTTLPSRVRVTGIPDLIPSEELGILAQQTLVVEVSASIASCHQKIVPSKQSEEVPSEEDPSEEDPSEEDPSEEDPSEEDPSEDAPSEEDPSEDAPSEEDQSEDGNSDESKKKFSKLQVKKY